MKNVYLLYLTKELNMNPGRNMLKLNKNTHNKYDRQFGALIRPHTGFTIFEYNVIFLREKKKIQKSYVHF